MNYVGDPKVKVKDAYVPLAIGNISTVSEEEWAEHWRQHGSGWRNPTPENQCYLERAYGGSDMSIICNRSPWTTNIDLWSQKTGKEKAVKPKRNDDPLVLGHLYETVTAQKYAILRKRDGCKNLKVYVDGKIVGLDGHFLKNKDGKFIENDVSNLMYRDGRKDKNGNFIYPWALANCDAFIQEGKEFGGLEIKTTSNRNVEAIEHWKSGIVPEYYLLQCVYYMAILNLRFWDICCSWGQTFEDMAYIRIYRDYDLEKWLFQKVAEFDTFVQNNIEPTFDDADGELLMKFYYQLFGPVDKNKPMIELGDKQASIVRQALQYKKEEDEFKKLMEEAKEKKNKALSSLYPIMKDSPYAQVQLSDTELAKITLRSPSKLGGIDEAKLKAEHPDVYKMYLRFDSSAFNKHSDTKLVREYKLPPKPDTEDGNKLPSFSISTKAVVKK